MNPIKTHGDGHGTDPATLSALARNVACIVEDKITRISRAAYASSNTLANCHHRSRYARYSLPEIVGTLCGLLAECADPATSEDRLEGIASFATTGETRERAFAKGGAK